MATRLAEAARKLTYEDYCRIPEDGLRHEIIDGVEYVSPSPNLHHQRVGGRIFLAIAKHLERSRGGEVFFAPLDVLLGTYSVVQPDVLVVLEASRERLKFNGAHGPPDLCVEVLSPSNPEHDAIRKRRLYERSGVFEYWIVDPALSKVDVYRLGPGGLFARPVVLFADQGETLETPLLPGLVIGLSELFAKPPGG